MNIEAFLTNVNMFVKKLKKSSHFYWQSSWKWYTKTV